MPTEKYSRSTATRSNLILVVGFAVFALIAAKANAASDETNSSADLATLPLESLMTMTVSSASRVSQSISSAPATVVVLTAQDIRDFGWRTLSDALATIPGLYTSTDRTYDYLGARGFQRPGDYNSRFLLLIDGMRVNDSVYDQAPIGADFPLDMDLVKRIEFVAGPGSAVYGSNALFGVINVITKDGKDIDGAQAAVAAGSYGEKRGRGTYGWHGSNGADLVVSASAYERNGQNLYYPEFDTPDQNNGVAVGLDYERSQQLFAKFAFDDFRLSIGYGNRSKGVPDAPYGAVFNAPFNLNDTHAFVDATYHQAIRDTVSLDYEVYWGRYDYLARQQQMPLPPVTNDDADRAIWYGADIHVTSTAWSHQRIVAGIDFTRDADSDQVNYNVNPYQSILDDHRESSKAGAYVDDEIDVTHGLTLDVGARYDVETRQEGAFNPRVALIYKPTEANVFKAIYGMAYRTPNAYEMYYAYPGQGGQEGNASLGAEHITTEEFVYEHTFTDTGRLTVSVFRYAMSDLISETTDPSTGLFVFENAEHTQAKGAEIAYEQRWSSGASVRASYSYQHSTADDADTAGEVLPHHMGKLNAVVPVFHGVARAAAELRCNSARAADAAYSGGYCVANLSLGTSKLIPHTDLIGYVYNVANHRYAEPSGPGFVQETIDQQSRTFMIKAVVGF
ncbi:iron complex outermembrane recepter protein [Pararobbsia alpina]